MSQPRHKEVKLPEDGLKREAARLKHDNDAQRVFGACEQKQIKAGHTKFFFFS